MTKSLDVLLGYFSSIATLSLRSQYTREKTIDQYNRFLQERTKTLLTATLIDLTAYAEMKVENKNEDLRIARITFKTYLKYILYFYQFAVDEGYYSQKELKRIEKYERRFSFETGEEKTRLSKKEVNLLLEEVNCHMTLKIATFMILNVGFRISELTNLKVSDIDFTKDLITIRLGKGRKTRRIPILDYQKPHLKKILQLRQGMLTLGSKEDHFLINKITGRKTSINWLQNYYVRISKKLGFRVHAHRLRRTFASILFFDHKIDLYLIAWLLGHTNIQTTMRYLGLKEQQKQQDYKEKMRGKVIVPLT